MSGDLFIAPFGSDEPRAVGHKIPGGFRDLGFLTTDGITEAPTDADEFETTWPGGEAVMSDKTWTLPIEGVPGSVLKELFPEPTHPTVEGTWKCPRCGVGVPMSADVESITRLDDRDRIEALVTNPDDLRDHIATHGIDPDPETPLRLTIEVKR